jgi:hypothetical protein
LAGVLAVLEKQIHEVGSQIDQYVLEGLKDADWQEVLAGSYGSEKCCSDIVDSARAAWTHS